MCVYWVGEELSCFPKSLKKNCIYIVFFFKLSSRQAAVGWATKDLRETAHNLTQTMSSARVYSGPWSHQDTPSILMLFMREQPQLSERICVKMVRAAWRHSSLQALHLCGAAGRLRRLCLPPASFTKRVHPPKHKAPPPPPSPQCQRTGTTMTNPRGRWQVWAGAETNGCVGFFWWHLPPGRRVSSSPSYKGKDGQFGGVVCR